MDFPYSPLEFALLNNWQRDFPLTVRPFAEIARQVREVTEGTCGWDGVEQLGEAEVLRVLQRLVTRGAISRIGAVFAPRRVGAGALAALAAPMDQIDQIAAVVSAFPSVNHNYQREHHYNLWFVVTASDPARLRQTLAEIEAATACSVIAMPLSEEFHIDLGFDLRSGHSSIKLNQTQSYAPRELSEEERCLAAELQDGLGLTVAPYEDLAKRAAMSETQVLEILHRWQVEGLIKRFGVVVRHHELGYQANAMVVFDVPDAHASSVGKRLATEAGVTLCYRRERCLPAWPFNVYCMVHGQSRDEVLPVINRLAAHAGVEPTILFSVRRFKQCGARYF